MNDFSKLNAQDEMSALAKISGRELAHLSPAPELGQDVSEFEGESEPDGEPMGSHDLSDDADALASAGFGTDEDYGGEREDSYLDASYEDRTEMDMAE
jgi:hypothetical protein